MKKLILFIVVAIGIGFFLRVFFAEKRTIIIGMECDYVPNNWQETRPTASNMPLDNYEGLYAEGYDLQIAKAITKELGMDLKVKKIEWNDLIPALRRGEIDAIFSGMLDTDERRKDIAFSDTYEVKKAEYGIIVNANTKYANATKLEHFYAARMIGQKGTLLDTAIDQIPGAIHLEPVNTVPEMLAKLEKNEADAIVINLDTGHSYQRTYDHLKLIEFAEGDGFVFAFNGICAGVRKRDTELLNQINKALGGISTRDRQRLMDRTIARLWENT